jgi:RNA polymerase sigma-70 factor (ECF subfamily)
LNESFVSLTTQAKPTTDARDALYRAHAPAAFRRARQLLGRESEAHEVVHDVFLGLFERPEQFQGKSSMSTFMYSAITHACLTRLRNERNRVRLLHERASFEEAFAASREGLGPEQRAQLASLLGALPEPLGQVAVYHYMDELTQDDIARILGCSRRHVGNLLERITAWVLTEASSCST